MKTIALICLLFLPVGCVHDTRNPVDVDVYIDADIHCVSETACEIE